MAILTLPFGCLALSKGEGEGQLIAVDGRHRPLTSILSPSARGEESKAGEFRSLLSRMFFPFAVVPKAEFFTRTDSAGTAEDYAKEFGQKIFRRIHAQFPG